jgi:hypothetical protein
MRHRGHGSAAFVVVLVAELGVPRAMAFALALREYLGFL